MDSSGQAAWVQAIGTLLAIAAAVAIPLYQRHADALTKSLNDRKIVMGAATNLHVALDYASITMNFLPCGDGSISHDFTLEQARNIVKFEPGTREALKEALDKSHYFDEKLCGKIVLLNLHASAYERAVDEIWRLFSDGDVDTFLRKVQPTRKAISEQLDEIRGLLKEYLPKNK